MTCFSYSALSAFEQCPKKYDFKYRIKPVVVSSTTVEAFVGSRVHEALEHLYRDVSMGRRPSADDLAGWFQRSWDAEWSDDVAVASRDYGPDDYRCSGESMLRTYHARYEPFDDGVSIGLELRVNADLDEEGRYGLVGYIDRLTRTGDRTFEIHDYKTGRSLPTQQQLDADLQLALYELAVRRCYPDVREVSLVWHYLALDTELRSVRTLEQLESMRADVIERMAAIERAVEFPTKTSALCGWCEYKELCPAWTHEADLAAGPGEATDGAELVDRLAEVEAQAGIIEAEREALRERLIRWAGEHGYERVVGTGCSAKIWRTEASCSLPQWDTPERAELERVIREAGLWDEYSSLAGPKLSKALEAGRLPGEVRDRVLAYVEVGPRARVYLNRRR